MSNSPKISFVCPTYNRVGWLSECLQSLRAQTVKEIEIIVVDDCSRDGTNELLEWFKQVDERIKVVTNDTNMGAGKSRNRGNLEASASLIGVCDSDDVYLEDRAEKTLEFFEKNPNYRIVNTPYIRVGYFNEVKEQFPGEPFNDEVFKEQGLVNYFCHPSCAYYKEDILAIGGYDSETKEFTDDFTLVKKWIKSGRKIGFFKDEPNCLHRVLPSSIMAKMRGWKKEWAA